LLAAAGDGGAYAVTADGPHALCAVWRIDRAGPLLARLAAGDHPPVREALEACGAKPVMFDDPSLFENANTPRDLARLEARLSGRRQT
jgi:molybdopterin-guanine dinucleotide biosynthesis protein A